MRRKPAAGHDRIGCLVQGLQQELVSLRGVALLPTPAQARRRAWPRSPQQKLSRLLESPFQAGRKQTEHAGQVDLHGDRVVENSDDA